MRGLFEVLTLACHAGAIAYLQQTQASLNALLLLSSYYGYYYDDYYDYYYYDDYYYYYYYDHCYYDDDYYYTKLRRLRVRIRGAIIPTALLVLLLLL